MLADELRAFREFKKKYCFILKELTDVNGIRKDILHVKLFQVILQIMMCLMN